MKKTLILAIPLIILGILVAIVYPKTTLMLIKARDGQAIQKTSSIVKMLDPLTPRYMDVSELKHPQYDCNKDKLSTTLVENPGLNGYLTIVHEKEELKANAKIVAVISCVQVLSKNLANIGEKELNSIKSNPEVLINKIDEPLSIGQPEEAYYNCDYCERVVAEAEDLNKFVKKFNATVLN